MQNKTFKYAIQRLLDEGKVAFYLPIDVKVDWHKARELFRIQSHPRHSVN